MATARIPLVGHAGWYWLPARQVSPLWKTRLCEFWQAGAPRVKGNPPSRIIEDISRFDPFLYSSLVLLDSVRLACLLALSVLQGLALLAFRALGIPAIPLVRARWASAARARLAPMRMARTDRAGNVQLQGCLLILFGGPARLVFPYLQLPRHQALSPFNLWPKKNDEKPETQTQHFQSVLLLKITTSPLEAH